MVETNILQRSMIHKYLEQQATFEMQTIFAMPIVLYLKYEVIYYSVKFRMWKSK